MSTIELQRMLEVLREGGEMIRLRELDLTAVQIMTAYDSFVTNINRVFNTANIAASDEDKVLYADIKLSIRPLMDWLRQLLEDSRFFHIIRTGIGIFEEKVMFKKFDNVRELLASGLRILELVTFVKNHDVDSVKDIEEAKKVITNLRHRWEELDIEITPALLNVLKKLEVDLHIAPPPPRRPSFLNRYAPLIQIPLRRSSRTIRPSQRKVESNAYLARSSLSSSRAISASSSSHDHKPISSKSKYSVNRISSRTRSRTRAASSKKRKVSKRIRSK